MFKRAIEQNLELKIAMEEASKEITPEKARAFLSKLSMYDSEGRLINPDTPQDKNYLIAYLVGFQSRLSIERVAAFTSEQALFLFLLDKGHKVYSEMSISEMIEVVNNDFSFVSEPYEI